MTVAIPVKLEGLRFGPDGADTAECLARLEHHRKVAAARLDGVPMAGSPSGIVEPLPDDQALDRWRAWWPTDAQAASVTVVLVSFLVTRDGWWTAGQLLPGLRSYIAAWDRTDAVLLWGLAIAVPAEDWHEALHAALQAAERLDAAERATLTASFQAALDRLEGDEPLPAATRTQLLARVRWLLSSDGASKGSCGDTDAINQGDGWGRFAVDRVRAYVAGHPTEADRVTQVLVHAAAARSGPLPTASWLKRARECQGVDVGRR